MLQVSPDVSSAPEARPLGLKRESSTPKTEKPSKCGPEGVWLRSTDGLLVAAPCGCPNKCECCGKRKAWESAEMLALDALHGEAPSVWLCLGTRETDATPARFYRAREKVLRALRRRWPGVEYVAKFEMTSGYGPRSGGKRRPHWHLLLKGIPRAQAAEAFDVAARVWCGLVDAEVGAQRGGEITAAPGLIRYITAHFGKESQAPPRGWKGQREVRSRGYLWLPAAQARDAARESIARRRAAHRAKQGGHAPTDVVLEVEVAMQARAARTWSVRYGDGSDESHMLYEADRVRGRLGGWKAARGSPPDWKGVPQSPPKPRQMDAVCDPLPF